MVKENTVPFGAPKLAYTEVETDGKSEQHVGVLNASRARSCAGEPLVARGEEGINGLTLSNAMHLSAWLGRAVEIPFNEDLYYEGAEKADCNVPLEGKRGSGGSRGP